MPSIELMLIEYAHIPERQADIQQKALNAMQRKRDAEEQIGTATRTSQQKFYTDKLSDTVSKIIDEYESQLEFYCSELRNYNEKERKVHNALAVLDDIKYKIIKLRYMEHLTWEEIAERVSYSRRQCINLKNRAMSELKKLCEGGVKDENKSN